MTLLIDPVVELKPEEDLPYDVAIVPEQEGDQTVWVAYHPQLRGCMSHGDTPEEALENLAEARAMYLDALMGAGVPVPEPKLRPLVAIQTTYPLRSAQDPPQTRIAQLRWQVVRSGESE